MSLIIFPVSWRDSKLLPPASGEPQVTGRALLPSLEWQREFPEVSPGARGRGSGNRRLLTRLELFPRTAGPSLTPRGWGGHGGRRGRGGEEGWRERGHVVQTLQLSRHSPLLLHVNPGRVIFTFFLENYFYLLSKCWEAQGWAQLQAVRTVSRQEQLPPLPQLPCPVLPPCSCRIPGLLLVIPAPGFENDSARGSSHA